MICGEQQRWYVAQTKPRRERVAAMELVRQGFEVFLPRYNKRKSKAARYGAATAIPLFPGYVFVSFSSEQRWRSINGTNGVVRLISHGDCPQPVPKGIVEAIFSRTNEDGIVAIYDAPAIRPGDKVQIVGGSFADMFGVFENSNDRERVAILLKVLGREVRVMIEADLLVKAA